MASATCRDTPESPVLSDDRCLWLKPPRNWAELMKSVTSVLNLDYNNLDYTESGASAKQLGQQDKCVQNRKCSTHMCRPNQYQKCPNSSINCSFSFCFYSAPIPQLYSDQLWMSDSSVGLGRTNKVKLILKCKTNQSQLYTDHLCWRAHIK